MRAGFLIAIVFCLLPAMHLYANPLAIRVADAWVSEAPPTVSINAAYLLIENSTEQSITLKQIDSPDFERIEMHRSILTEGTAKMELQPQVEIAAFNQFQFSPGNYHLMLFNPRKQLRAGDFTSFTLHFSGGIQIDVEAAVKRLQPDHSHQH